MSYLETKLPRVLATVLLAVSVAMFGLLVRIVLIVLRGGAVPSRSWLFPLIILATGAILMSLLTRKQLSLRLYLSAFALWLLTTGYYFAYAMSILT